MSKGFNPNPKKGQTYLSIENQIERLLEQCEKDKNSTPVFQTYKKRLQVLKQVAHDLAVSKPDYHFSVFSDDVRCVITEHKPLEYGFSYTWLEQSKISGKWMVMAKPPGSTRYDCLTVRKEEEARKVALDIIESIRNFPVEEWDKKYQSKYYRSLLRSLPMDDDSITSLITPDTLVNFDADAKKELKTYYNQVMNSEINREEFYYKMNDVIEKQKQLTIK
ncbi:MAG: hypothetical protein KME64_40890 [Scytonematopsis contorta HA4267-MV1]|jgi:hypothetical protein|nr:hypothetical protein [Scytonematopsis contorta HA4267-MV1]